MSDTQRSISAQELFTDVIREDREQKSVRVVEGQLLVCKGCCCGNVDRGHPAVPVTRFKQEWKARGIRSRVHLTISGCLGPCALRNIVMLVYQGSIVWFHSINSDEDVVRIYDYVEELLACSRFDLPTGSLTEKVFQRYTSDAICPLEGEI